MKKISAIALSACFLLLPLSACGEDDGGLTKLEINEVIPSSMPLSTSPTRSAISKRKT